MIKFLLLSSLAAGAAGALLRGQATGDFAPTRPTLLRSTSAPARVSTPLAEPVREFEEDGADRHIVFGLDGKTKANICAAIDSGFRHFDGGDTYGNTVAMLGECMREKNVPRRFVHLVYKIAVTQAGAPLEAHLREVANSLPEDDIRGKSPYVDECLIHHVGERDNDAAVWNQLAALEQAGLVHGRGCGDVGPATADMCAGGTSIQMNALDLLVHVQKDSEWQSALSNFYGTHVYLYGVVDATRRIMGSVNPANIRALMSHVGACFGESVRPIMSSSDAQRIAKNFALGNGLGDVSASGVTDKIKAYIAASSTLPDWNAAPGGMPTDVKQALLAAQKDFDTIYEDPDKFDKKKNKFKEGVQSAAKAVALARVTGAAASTKYRFADGFESFSFTDMVEKLFSGLSCDRKRVAPFILEVILTVLR
jgi:hypothetical protein